MTQRDTYTPEQVAEVAGVTRRTVYRWITSDRLPAHKIGPKMWVVYRQVLTAFMAGAGSDKLQNMAASLQGRKTVLTPAPLPGAIYPTAAEESAELLDSLNDDEDMSDEEAEEFLQALIRTREPSPAPVYRSQPVQAALAQSVPVQAAPVQAAFVPASAPVNRNPNKQHKQKKPRR